MKPWLKAGLYAAGISVLLQIIAQIPFLNCILLPVYCVSWFLLPGAAGFFAAKWADIGKNKMAEAAKTATLAGLVLGGIGGVVSFIISLLSTLLNITTQTAFSAFSDESYSDVLPFATATGFGGTLLCGSVGFFIGLIVNVLFAVIGGIIESATSKE